MTFGIALTFNKQKKEDICVTVEKMERNVHVRFTITESVLFAAMSDRDTDRLNLNSFDVSLVGF